MYPQAGVCRGYALGGMGVQGGCRGVGVCRFTPGKGLGGGGPGASSAAAVAVGLLGDVPCGCS